ncbi:hypothetical protein J7E79_25055 [Bacillus sp. ISL-40]|uniref:hypothetical protein n=1 Tax=unclassified Bacillus (in: firmicutes) TaxID=185979 RepID=UPI001BE9FC52|nr:MULTISPECIES: hypothetical protein [unclassified Bacillus (in: firmicutes)]MBT2700610.1 hypothetical protein [Bacillus sp. ISL-40]MBT2725271.1 hypothetical protein [Bacillus sp. ISL-46]MBT2744120.1 hypothetical protein [Bacillus sp. ISL-77]
MNEKQQYVWYASYGSNINADRFLCYIKGGQPEGSAQIEIGCKDPSLPVDESTFTIDLPLYFAKEAARWESQGVAFIGLNQDKGNHTYSKKYLITGEQFLDVVKQENNGLNFEIDLHEVKQKGSKVFHRHSWYGNILYLGDENGFPIYTFTAPWDINEVEWKKPSPAYLKTIIKGLSKNYSNEEIFAYFQSKPGIKDQFPDHELTLLLNGREG